MKNIIMIINKEFAKFFGDRRLFFTACIMPGLMIYIIYSLLGGVIGRIVNEAEDPLTSGQVNESQVFCSDLPESIQQIFSEQNIIVNEIPYSETDDIKRLITEKEALLCVIFPPEFDKSVEGYDVFASQGQAPNIEMFYNSSENKSGSAFGQMEGLLNEYEKSISNKFDINRTAKADPAQQNVYDLASSKDLSGSILSAMIPLLLIIFLYSGCLAVAPESIAGEKERGTIATLLVTQIKRSELAIGKIISLMVIALLCGLSSSLGMLLSIPRMLGAGLAGVSIDFYTAFDYILLIVMILSTILVIVSLLTNISAFARTVKEAMTIANPLMIVVMLAGVSSLMGVNSKTVYYLIPIYNSAQCISSILGFESNPLNMGVTIATNLTFAALGAFLLSKMFNSERIVFTR